MQCIIIQTIKQHIPYIPEHVNFTVLTFYQQLISYPIIISPQRPQMIIF